MDFTLDKYRELLLALKDAGYELMRYNDYCEGRRAEKLVVMRHDVDRLVARAKAMAALEHEIGVKASYYFREKFIDEEVKYFASLGHEVGYHYEDLVSEQGDVDKAYARCVRNIDMMRQMVDVRTITMHGSPMSDIDSKRMWEAYDYKKIGVIGEPQIDVDWEDMCYFTDTGRSWNGVSRRDRMGKNDKKKKQKIDRYCTTEDIIKALIEGSFPCRVMLTVHPLRWTDNVCGWIYELVSQKIKNFVKIIICKICRR